MALPPIQIKDLPGVMSPQLAYRVPAQLPTGETVYLSIDQILSVIKDRDVELGDVIGDLIVSKTGNLRSKALLAGDALLRLTDDADAVKAIFEWIRSDGKVKLVRSAGGELTLQGSGVDDLLWGVDKIWNAGNYTPVAERLAAGSVVTNTTEVELTIPTGYRRFVLAVEDAKAVTDNQGYLALRYKIGGTWYTTGYRWATMALGQGGAAYNDHSAAILATHMLLAGTSTQVGANARSRFLVDIFPGDATTYPSHTSRGTTSQAGTQQALFAGGQNPQLGRLEGLRILYYNNTIASMTYELQGVRA